MRHHLRGRLLVAAGAATAVVLAPLPVAAGVSLSTGSNLLADVLPGLTTSATPAPRQSSAVATPTPTDPATSAPSATAPETSAPADPTPVAPATPTPVSAEAISNGPRDKAQVAITLDADLSEQTLYRINEGTLPAQVNVGVLDFLEATGTPATVFV
ncbi:MAG: NodB y protein, partial [Actinomycetota bacterium]|nr:NodB y protein [Actinomycetota bacterium]